MNTVSHQIRSLVLDGLREYTEETYALLLEQLTLDQIKHFLVVIDPPGQPRPAANSGKEEIIAATGSKDTYAALVGLSHALGVCRAYNMQSEITDTA